MKSIRQTLTYRLLGGLLLLVACSGLLLYGALRNFLVGDFDASLHARAHALASLVMHEANGRIEYEYVEPTPSARRGPRSDEVVEIWLEDGRVVSRSAGLGSRDLPRPPDMLLKPHYQNMTMPDGHRGRAISFHFTPQADPDPNEVGNGTLIVLGPARAFMTLALDREPLDHALWFLRLALGGAGLFLPFGITLIVRRGVLAGLSPLARVAADVSAVDSRNLAYRFPESGLPAELQPIVLRLNDLLARMEAAFARERRFTSAVAHELRTPIAELHSMAEMALFDPGDQALAQTSATEVLAISRQMERLVANLLALARCEAGLQTLTLEPVDLDSLLAQAWAPFAADAQIRTLTCTRTVEPGLQPRTDRALFLSVLQNLLSNAVAYTPPGGRIDIQAGRVDGRVQLRVVNADASLTPADLPHLFEPFWRKDGARTDGSHSGLGLTLVQAICRQLAINLAISLDEPNQVAVQLTLKS